MFGGGCFPTLLLCIVCLFWSCLMDVVVAQLPASYDSRSIWKQYCSGFSIIQNQGNCSSCCAMALSSAISARECMRDGRDIAYSAQQIWDCAGASASATCKDGSYLDSLIRSLGRGIHSSQSLIKGNCSVYSDRDVDTNKCKVSFDQCSVDPDGPSQIEGSVFYDLMWFSGNADFAAWTASKSMMTEIFTNGPVVTVISLTSDEYFRFNQESYLKNKRVLVPDSSSINNNNSLQPSAIVRHCLMVYGWGQDEITGLNYWLVQNSWGESWGDGGTARILRGMNWLETEWRGVSTSPRPCIKGDKCLNLSSIIQKNISSSSEKKNILQFDNIKQMNYKIYTTTSSAVLGGMSNLEIFSITMAVAFGISFLIYMLPGSLSSAPSYFKKLNGGAVNNDGGDHHNDYRNNNRGGGISFLPRLSAHNNSSNFIPEIVSYRAVSPYPHPTSFSSSMEGVFAFSPSQWRR
jgi:cathepsin B